MANGLQLCRGLHHQVHAPLIPPGFWSPVGIPQPSGVPFAPVADSEATQLAALERSSGGVVVWERTSAEHADRCSGRLVCLANQQGSLPIDQMFIYLREIFLYWILADITEIRVLRHQTGRREESFREKANFTPKFV